MTTQEIWMLPVDQRIEAFIERWRELDEFTGNRTHAEHAEMAEIADAIMTPLIEWWGWRPQVVELMKRMVVGNHMGKHAGITKPNFADCREGYCKDFHALPKAAKEP